MIPEEPRDVVHDHGEEHVLVDGDAGTAKRGERELKRIKTTEAK